MPPKNSNKGKEFSDICSYIKDKCDELKENNVSVAETIDLLTDRFAKEGEKLPETESEKTALNVISLICYQSWTRL